MDLEYEDPTERDRLYERAQRHAEQSLNEHGHRVEPWMPEYFHLRVAIHRLVAESVAAERAEIKEYCTTRQDLIDGKIAIENFAGLPELKGMMKNTIGKGWAWRIESGLCHWAEPRRCELETDQKPSPEAVKIHVAIVPMKLWRKLSKPSKRPAQKARKP